MAESHRSLATIFRITPCTTTYPTSIQRCSIYRISPSWASPNRPAHKPRILLLYETNRERSYSRLLVQEAARLLERFGAETRIFNPSGLPLPDDAPDSHPKVQELRDLMQWSEGRCGARRNGMAR